MPRTTELHATTARKNLEVQLREQGHKLTLDEGISAGLLTDMDWCDELERQRDIYKINLALRPKMQEGGRNSKGKRKRRVSKSDKGKK